MKKIIFLVGLALMMLFVSGCSQGAGGYATASPCGCKLTLGEAKFESKIKDDHGGCIADCSADIHVKNIENQPTLAYVTATCKTVNKEGVYQSEKYWMQPNSDHNFEIKVDAGIGEDWKCSNFAVYSSQIAGCEAYSIN